MPAPRHAVLDVNADRSQWHFGINSSLTLDPSRNWTADIFGNIKPISGSDAVGKALDSAKMLGPWDNYDSDSEIHDGHWGCTSLGIDLSVSTLLGLSLNEPSAESVANVPWEIRALPHGFIEKADVGTKSRLSIDILAAPRLTIGPISARAGPEFTLTVAHVPMRTFHEGKMNFSSSEYAYYEAVEKEDIVRKTFELGVQPTNRLRISVGFKDSSLRYRIETGRREKSTGCGPCGETYEDTSYETYRTYDVGRAEKRTEYVSLSILNDDGPTITDNGVRHKYNDASGVDFVVSRTDNPWPASFSWGGQAMPVKGRTTWGFRILLRYSPQLHFHKEGGD